jgi:hypothetical protein
MTSVEDALLFKNYGFVHQEFSTAFTCMAKFLRNGPLEICFSTTIMLLLIFLHICRNLRSETA